MSMKRGDVYVCRGGGRAIIEKIGREGGKREGMVKAHFLGTGTRWVEREFMGRGSWWRLALPYDEREESWDNYLASETDDEARVLPDLARLLARTPPWEEKPVVEERNGWRVGDVAVLNDFTTGEAGHWVRTLGEDWVWRDRYGREQWWMNLGDDDVPYTLIERDGKRVRVVS